MVPRSFSLRRLAGLLALAVGLPLAAPAAHAATVASTPWRASSAPLARAAVDGAAASSGCADYTIYGVRGSGEAWDERPFEQGGTLGMGNTAGPAAAIARSTIPTSTSVRLVGVRYPAAPVSTLVGNPGTFFLSIRNGVTELKRLIRRSIAACPKGRIGLVGYSQGAGVVSETLRALPRSAFKRVRVAVLFADTYSAGQRPYSRNFDQARPLKPRSKKKRRGRGVFGARKLPRALKAKYDVCFLQDIVCNRTSSTFKTYGQAFDNGIHTQYKTWRTSVRTGVVQEYGFALAWGA